MKRGFPQYLHPPRLDEIRKTWLTHSVPSFVARKMEALLCVLSLLVLLNPALVRFARPRRRPTPDRPRADALPPPTLFLSVSDGGGWMSF